jgi:hypothetical protein
MSVEQNLQHQIIANNSMARSESCESEGAAQWPQQVLRGVLGTSAIREEVDIEDSPAIMLLREKGLSFAQIKEAAY